MHSADYAERRAFRSPRRLTMVACAGPIAICSLQYEHRPADILLRSSGPRPVAVDVTITHTLRSSASSAARGDATAAADQAEDRKVALSGEACAQVGWGFAPFALTTTGGLGQSGDRLASREGRSSEKTASETRHFREVVGNLKYPSNPSAGKKRERGIFVNIF